MPEPDDRKTPRRALTPLWVIALFVSTAEAVLGVAATRTTGGVQVALTAFVIAFPVLVATAFFLILWFRPHHLYAPGDYGEKVTPREFIEAIVRAKPYDRDVASNLLRLFWKPDGRTVRKQNADELTAWMKSNGLGRVAITTLLHSDQFRDARRKAVENLRLTVRPGV